MRLLSHNLLQCNKKGVMNGYPLKIEVEEVQTQETEFNKEFIQHMLPKLNWPALVQGAAQMGITDTPLPETLTADLDDDTLKRIHHVLLEVTVKEGALICPESGRRFPIKNGIPNMLLNEDEV